MTTLTVTAAAIIDDDGTVFSVPPPGRHHNVIWLMADQGRPCPCISQQGFVLSDGRYVGREEAKIVAINAGQLLDRASNLDILFSEDVLNENLLRLENKRRSHRHLRQKLDAAARCPS